MSHVCCRCQESSGNFTQNGQTYDIIFDTVGKSSVPGFQQALTDHGAYLVATFGLPTLVQLLWLSRTSSKRVVMGLLQEKADDLVFLKELIEAGKFRSVIDHFTHWHRSLKRIGTLKQAARVEVSSSPWCTTAADKPCR